VYAISDLLGISPFVPRILFSLWAVAIGAWDRVEKRIPNWLVFPAILALIVWRVYEAIVTRSAQPVFSLLLIWAILFLVWIAHFYGGGDAKFLMALFGFFPTIGFLLLLCIAVIITRAPVVVSRYIRRRNLGESSMEDLLPVHRLPTEDDLHKRGQPNSWTFALAGLIYVWWAQ